MENTALLVEPRFLERLPLIIEQFRKKLPGWKIVFYCGLGLLEKWKPLLHESVELRELQVSSFDTAALYSNFMKSKELWNSLSGDYVLTFQADTWVLNDECKIDTFMQMNKSFIGGNMEYVWFEMEKYLGYQPDHRNFNGGLSLRKRADMLRVIDEFPPQPTDQAPYSHCIESCNEDVYFVLGCYKLNLPVGDDEESSHFSVHCLVREPFFGMHLIKDQVKEYLVAKYPELLNSYI